MIKLAVGAYEIGHNEKALIRWSDRLYIVCHESLLRDTERLQYWAGLRSRIMTYNNHTATKHGTIKAAWKAYTTD